MLDLQFFIEKGFLTKEPITEFTILQLDYNKIEAIDVRLFETCHNL